MAVVTSRVDDIDGVSNATETITFSYEGTSYEIDLSEKNVKAFRSAFEKYADKARPVKTTKSNKASSGDSDAAKIREWAHENGIKDVPSRGRISAELREQYEAAMKSPKPKGKAKSESESK